MAKKSQTDYSHLCGWVPPEKRTDEMHEADAVARATMPKFAIYGAPSGDLPDRVVMTEFWDHEDVEASLGFKHPGIHQITGSCVGAGGGDVIFTTLLADIFISKRPHKILFPFWLLPYGRSRSRAGMRGKGEGSFGTTFAAAASQDGFLDAADPDLPKYEQKDGLVWGRTAELAWSDGNAIAQKFLTAAKYNIVGTTAVQDSASGVQAGLQNWYAHTIATSMYCHPQNCKVKEGMLVGAFDTNGGHQTKILGFKLHPVLGPMYFNVNNWGKVYPKDPETGRQDGCWNTQSSMQWACAQREVIAFSGINGFQARTWDWTWK